MNLAVPGYKTPAHLMTSIAGSHVILTVLELSRGTITLYTSCQSVPGHFSNSHVRVSREVDMRCLTGIEPSPFGQGFCSVAS